MDAPDLLPRHAAPLLVEALADSPVVLIHGPRQCGKTTLARMVGEPRGYRYLSFEDGELTVGFGERLFALPIRLLFLNDGPTRMQRLADGRESVLKQTTPRNMQTAGRISGTVIAALRWLGRDAVDDAIIGKLRRRLSDQDKAILREDAPNAPAYWPTTAPRRIADEGEPAHHGAGHPG